MQIKTDGYIDLRDGRKVRTPGIHESVLEPVPEAEALAFLLSHTFPGQRKMNRPLNTRDRRQLRLALWEDSVESRMSLADRVWRSVSEAVEVISQGKPRLLQIIQHGKSLFLLYVDEAQTRISPAVELDASELASPEAEVFDAQSTGERALAS